LARFFPRQLVFFLVGLPGLLIVLLMLTVREPVRGGYLSGGPKPPLPLAEARAYFRKEWRMVVFHNFGFAFQTMATYASGYWTPAFLMRVLGWDIQKVGDVYGLVVIIFATSGIVVGGQMADFLRKRGKHYGRQTVMIAGMLLTALFGMFLPVLASDANVVFLLIPMVFFSSFGVGTATAVVQEVNPPQLRSLASAIFLFIVNISGNGRRAYTGGHFHRICLSGQGHGGLFAGFGRRDLPECG
ncbi:MAG: MFS transporter, partial [Microscillaceae bacterium]|nr:MFS transporter [Microscillaceae bacterium]